MKISPATIGEKYDAGTRRSSHGRQDSTKHDLFENDDIFHLIAENYKGGGQEEIKQLFDCFQKDEKLRAKYWNKLDIEYKNKTVIALKNLYFWLTKRLPLIDDYQAEIQLDKHCFDEVDGTPVHLTGSGPASRTAARDRSCNLAL